MKLKFKTQAYQTAAVQAVVDCFQGQPTASAEAMTYRIDPGKARQGVEDLFGGDGFKNADLVLSDSVLLTNIHDVQRAQNLPLSDSVVKTKVSKINLDIEMETGTGKTYCYIKTIFELNKQYGWSKFIIVVPSVAIRAGVMGTLADFGAQLAQQNGLTFPIPAFEYDSNRLQQLKAFIDKIVEDGFDSLETARHGAVDRYRLVNRSEGRLYPIKGSMVDYARHILAVRASLTPQLGNDAEDEPMPSLKPA